jgi:hypothetical protein
VAALPKKDYTFYPGTSNLHPLAGPQLLGKEHTITAHVSIPENGAEGVLACSGGEFGEWTLFMKDSKLHYAHNYLKIEGYVVSSAKPVPPGMHTLSICFTPTGKNLKPDYFTGDVVLSVDGVPMGGDLKNAPAGKATAFMVQALRDPDGANLDRIQIIKGWLDANGQTHERIWDAAVSDGRTVGPDGRYKQPVGITVNVAEATYTNAIGDAVLEGYWQDPDFDRSQRAFYSVHVIEIPTPR